MELREQIDKMSHYGDDGEKEYQQRMKEMELQTHYEKTQKIDTYFNTNKEDSPQIIEELAKTRSKMGKRFKQSNETILLKFFRFMAIKLPDRNVVFNIKKAKIKFIQNRR